ncbi:MAG: FecR domain-containing protein [Burkholderiales bacterium]|nr:FecR domain-containing protein [Burkholderiales bacterium]
MLSIGAGSSVDLAEFQFNPTTHDGHVLISLLRGSLRLVTGLIAKLKPEQVKVTTPTTVIGVRGTDFIVEQR